MAAHCIRSKHLQIFLPSFTKCLRLRTSGYHFYRQSANRYSDLTLTSRSQTMRYILIGLSGIGRWAGNISRKWKCSQSGQEIVLDNNGRPNCPLIAVSLDTSASDPLRRVKISLIRSSLPTSRPATYRPVNRGGETRRRSHWLLGPYRMSALCHL